MTTHPPSASWWLLSELALARPACPAWCDGDVASDGPVCFFHAAEAVEDGRASPHDLTVGPTPQDAETATAGVAAGDVTLTTDGGTETMSMTDDTEKPLGVLSCFRGMLPEDEK